MAEENSAAVLTPTPSEPKLNRVERIKKGKDPFEVWEAIERYAVTGFDSIEKDDIDLFKWYGIYTQSSDTTGYFMLRIKLPNGDLTSTQLRTIASITQRFAQGLADVTDRQNFQLHWIQIENIPTIGRELEAVGLSLKGSSGDTVRNVIGCPLSGYDPTEIIDTWPLVEEVNRRLAGNSEFGNLPRKFKISISGCVEQCAHPEINDLGLVAVRKANGEVGFEAWVGGGLGSQPHLGQRLGVFIPPSAAVEVASHIIAIFRDHGYRKNRAHARLKFLLADWGVAKFREELEQRLGYHLEDGPAGYQAPANAYRDHVGAYLQKDGCYAL